MHGSIMVVKLEFFCTYEYNCASTTLAYLLGTFTFITSSIQCDYFKYLSRNLISVLQKIFYLCFFLHRTIIRALFHKTLYKKKLQATVISY